MNLQRVVAASRCIDGQLLLRAQRLAGMLHKLHFPEEESEADLLADMMAVAPDPAVGLVALLSQALDTAGVPPQQRLTNTLPLLESQLSLRANTGATPSSDPRPQQPEKPQPHQQDLQQQQQQQQQAGPLFTRQDLSTALLAMVHLLPGLMEDLPRAHVLLAELIGHLMAQQQLTCSFADLVDAVGSAREEGCSDNDDLNGDGDDGGPGWQPGPYLVEGGHAGAMLLTVADAVKEACGEAAVTAAWPDAAADLARLMPEGCGEGAVAQLLQQHNAEYLLT